MTSLPPASNAPRERLLYLDILRCVFILAAPITHATVDLNLSGNRSDTMIAVSYGALLLCCVPVLITISGALLLADTRPMNIATHYRKRLPKICIPLLAWSLLYYAVNVDLGDGIPVIFKTFVERFLTSTLSGPLWFLYMITGIYLVLPFLRPAFAGDTTKLSLACVTVIFGAHALDFILRLFAGQPLNPVFTGTLFSYFVGYFVLGNVLTRVRPKIPGGCATPAILFVLCAAVMALGEFSARTTHTIPTALFFTFQGPPVLCMTICAFLFFKNWNPSLPHKWARFVQNLSSLTYGIFLSHMLVLKLLSGELPLFFRRGHGLDCYTISPLIGPLLYGVAGFIGSALLAAAIRRIPVLRVIVP